MRLILYLKRYIGARLVAGGLGRPEGLNKGYFVRPTVFADVNNDMTIAREEIFGPVLSMIPFDTEEQAIEIANDTPYGLTNYIQSQDGARRDRRCFGRHSPQRREKQVKFLPIGQKYCRIRTATKNK